MASLNRLRLNPKKILLSKWTAAQPQQKEKHFIVIKLIAPDTSAELATPAMPIEWVDLQAVHSGRVLRLPWLQLSEQALWQQGWK